MVVGEWSVALGGRGKAALPASQVGGVWFVVGCEGVIYKQKKISGLCIDCRSFSLPS